MIFKHRLISHFDSIFIGSGLSNVRCQYTAENLCHGTGTDPILMNKSGLVAQQSNSLGSAYSHKWLPSPARYSHHLTKIQFSVLAYSCQSTYPELACMLEPTFALFSRSLMGLRAHILSWCSVRVFVVCSWRHCDDAVLSVCMANSVQFAW